MTTNRRGRRRIRWAAGSEPEMQCDRCLDWLPITSDFWVPEHGTARCRVCYRDDNNRLAANSNRHRRSNDQYRADEAANLRAKRHANRDWWLEYRRAYYRANCEHILARRRELYAARKEAA